MADIDIETVTGKLNRIGYDAFIGALRQAKNAGNSHVELAHWLYHIFQVDRSDMVLTADHFGLDRAKMLAEMQRAVDALRKNETQLPSISPAIVDCLDRGWHYATLMFGELQIRTGHVLVGALKDLELRRALLDISREFRNIPVERLTDEHHAIWRGSDEETLRPMDRSGLAGAPAAAGPAGEARPGGTSALARFAIDLTERASRGEMDPIVGREDEVRQVVDVLMRRRQNNPILVGEAGVGKTAVAEGFAQLIATDQVPPKLRGVRLHALDVGLLQAGASMKGEFEQRLRSVIDEVQSSPQPVILFIDEAHTLIGAGGQAGTGDAANLLKPALARGTLRTIAATTWGEYRQYFEKDPALTRRFQPVQIGEPSVERCCDMLRGLVGPMQMHHGVKVTDAALVAAVQLSHRYIPGRQLPDKAVSLLDTAAARVAITQSAIPAAIEDAKALIAARTKEKAVLETERELGTANEARIAEIDAEIETAETELAELETRWGREKALVEEINRLRDEIAKTSGGKPDGGDRAEAPAGGEPPAVAPGTGTAFEAQPQPLGAAGNPEVAAEAPASGDGGAAALADPRTRLREAVRELQEISPESRMLYAHVDEEAIAAVVSDWTGIPVGRMVRDEVEAVMRLPEILGRRVVGQSHGLEMIAKRIETNRARLDNPNKPIGVFMLCGPSGVGKTETALALAEALYGGEQNVITINMSEYQEAHTVALLKGAPPGYVGYGEGGRLTEAVRRRPYSVVLLDEVEKAHPDVHEIFFQVFDKGWMEDATGRHINFKNTLIIMTSNVGTELIMEAARDPENAPDPEALGTHLRPALLGVFPPALLGRIVTIPYYPLSPAMLAGIVRLHLDRIGKRLRENHKAAFAYGDDLLDHIIARCDDPDTGGRMIDNIITNTLLPQLSRKILSAALDQKEIARVRAYIDNDEITLEVE